MTTTKEEALRKLDQLKDEFDLLKEGSDALERRAIEQAEQLEAKTKEVGELQVRLAKFESLVQNLNELLPNRPSVAGATDLKVAHTPQEVLVTNPGNEPLEYTTTERKGQILWVLLHDLKHPSSEAMIGEAMVEYGWPGSHNALKDVISDMVNKDRRLIADNSTPRLYRTPSQVDFKAKDKPEKK